MGQAQEGGRKGGLGTSLVAALASQLEAQVAITSGAHGMNITVTHTTFFSKSTA